MRIWKRSSRDGVLSWRWWLLECAGRVLLWVGIALVGIALLVILGMWGGVPS